MSETAQRSTCDQCGEHVGDWRSWWDWRRDDGAVDHLCGECWTKRQQAHLVRALPQGELQALGYLPAATVLPLLRDALACLQHPFDAAHNAAVQARLVAAIGDAKGQP